MTFEHFRQSLSQARPATVLPIQLKAQWYDAKGNWKQAHNMLQNIEDAEASWIHAYLHRKEGDIRNADYWYSRAGKKRPVVSLEEEWEMIAKKVLQKIIG